MPKPKPRNNEVVIPEPADPLLRQLWLLKGDLPLDKFVEEFNSWGEQEHNNHTMRPQDRGRKLTKARIQAYLLEQSPPTSWDRQIISGRIGWLRAARSYRADALKGEHRTTPRDPTVIGIREDDTQIHKDETPVVRRDKWDRPLRKRNPTES